MLGGTRCQAQAAGHFACVLAAQHSRAVPPVYNALSQVLDDPKWPAKWPFRPEDFNRYDEEKDTVFYSVPRFVTHIDDYAINALTKSVPIDF